jgi:hypothetical protein
MAEYPPDTTNIALPVYRNNETPAIGSEEESKNEGNTEHLEASYGIEPIESTVNLHKKAAIATIQQQHTIPPTGKRLPTSKWEYIFFCIFCRCSIHNYE